MESRRFVRALAAGAALLSAGASTPERYVFGGCTPEALMRAADARARESGIRVELDNGCTAEEYRTVRLMHYMRHDHGREVISREEYLLSEAARRAETREQSASNE